MFRRPPAALLAVFISLGCTQGPPDRKAGDRSPLSASCERLDGTRCLLPWPSNTYTVVDETSATGLRLAIDRHSVPVHDTPATLNRADGFSVVTPLAAGFPVKIDHRVDNQRDPSFVKVLAADGTNTPVWLTVVDDAAPSTANLLIAYPVRPLAYNADYVVAVLDDLKADDGSALTAPDAVKVALGLSPAATPDDQALAAYHAPTRALLQKAGVDLHHVLRVWDFTTRSVGDFATPLDVMRNATLAALDAGTLQVSVDTVTPLATDAGYEVRGAIRNVPGFIADGGGFSLDAGLPMQLGVRDAPFRAVVPKGSADFPVVVFGHGTGGNVDDDTFDDDILSADAAKLNFEMYGWTDLTVIDTFLGLTHMFTETDHSTAGLLQANVDAMLFEAALPGILGDTFYTVSGARPDVSKTVYAGGSLGGTMGFVHSLTSPVIHDAVLNVPGAGWTHFIYPSALWSTIDEVFKGDVPSDLDRALALVMSQGNWDAVDGAAWAALDPSKHTVFLIQESMGDPVLPNIGESLLAECTHAEQIGAVLDPLEGLDAGTEIDDGNGITQFRVPSTVTAALDIHGFGAKDTPAGVAAREQISTFLKSAWAGTPKIVVPPTCVANGGSCDFSQSP
jgi:hypothetical protein